MSHSHPIQFRRQSLRSDNSSWASSYRRASLFGQLRDRSLGVRSTPSLDAFRYGSMDGQDVLSGVDGMDVENEDVETGWEPPILEQEVYQSAPQRRETFESNDNTIEQEEELDLESEEQDLLLPKDFELLGTSTFFQSFFNSCNILMGIGLLSLPFAFNITGWIVGISLLLIFSAITLHTGTLLQRCLDYEREDGYISCTYGDLGYVAFGESGRAFISFIFFLELIACTVALVILSADSIVALFPHLDLVMVKIIIVIAVFPLSLPKSLSIAAYGSILGILALLNLIGILFYDGLSTYTTPGSLWELASTELMPLNWFAVPLSFGLFMAGFAGHSVFPNVYRDMKQPELYGKLLNSTYFVVLVVYIAIGSIGYGMFGSAIKEEVITNGLTLIY
jgi:hypothetical protein